MTPAQQKAATAAFQQGVEDEKNGRGISARLLIKPAVRGFYEAARKQVRVKLAPAREARADREHAAFMATMKFFDTTLKLIDGGDLKAASKMLNEHLGL